MGNMPSPQHVMSGEPPILQLQGGAVFSAPIMVTSYQQQYFYTETFEEAKEFVRNIANEVKRPFSVR